MLVKNQKEQDNQDYFFSQDLEKELDLQGPPLKDGRVKTMQLYGYTIPLSRDHQ